MTTFQESEDSINKITIQDKWMFYYLYPVLSILVVHIGNDNSFSNLIQNPTYYADLIFSMSCCFAMGFFIRKLYARLERHFNWGKDQKKIIKRAIIYGIIFPTILIAIAEMFYLKFINIAILDSSIFYLELPLIFIFCLLINLVYLYQYNTAYSVFINKIQVKKDAKKENVMLERFVVGSGMTKQVLDAEEIAYFLVDNKLTYLVTFSGDRFHVEYPLKELKLKFSEDNFFLLNRQVLANKKSILRFNKTETRRLEIFLNPTLKDEVFVAKSNAKQFTDWMNLV